MCNLQQEQQRTKQTNGKKELERNKPGTKQFLLVFRKIEDIVAIKQEQDTLFFFFKEETIREYNKCSIIGSYHFCCHVLPVMAAPYRDTFLKFTAQRLHLSLSYLVTVVQRISQLSVLSACCFSSWSTAWPAPLHY